MDPRQRRTVELTRRKVPTAGNSGPSLPGLPGYPGRRPASVSLSGTAVVAGGGVWKREENGPLLPRRVSAAAAATPAAAPASTPAAKVSELSHLLVRLVRVAMIFPRSCRKWKSNALRSSAGP